MKAKVAQSCPTLCDPMAYTVHGILQARILEWVAFPFSRGPSQQGLNPSQVDSLPPEPQGKPRNKISNLFANTRQNRGFWEIEGSINCIISTGCFFCFFFCRSSGHQGDHWVPGSSLSLILFSPSNAALPPHPQHQLRTLSCHCSALEWQASRLHASSHIQGH